ncbi:MAG: hypothetical protein AAF223_20565, partial [Bacteroidota bacterium]
MKNLVTRQHSELHKIIFRSTLLLIVAVLINNTLYAQKTAVGVFDPENGDSRWVSGSGKIYTLDGKVGIGTATPARLLHVWGASHRYFRLTAEGGNQYSNAVAGLELQRRLENGNTLNWDIVNQGTFKIRRNTSTMFILDEDEAQLGTQAKKMTLNIWGKNVFSNGDQLYDGAIALRSSNGGPTNVLRLDGSKIESENELYLNWFSDENIRMAQDGNVGIGSIYSDLDAKLGVKSDGWQFNLMNGSKSWRIGVSNSDWAVGEGKLVFSNQESSTDALMVMTEQGRVGIGMRFPDRTLDVNGTARVRKLEIIGGADLAEPFEVSEANIQPGTVVVIDPANAGQLKMATAAYDKTVA